METKMSEQEFEDYIMGEAYEQMAEYEKEQDKIKSSFKKRLKGLVNVTGLFRWLEEEQDGWHPIAIVEIEPTDEKMHGYPNHQCCRIKGRKTLFMKCGFSEVRNIDHYYVWQVTGHLGDDYSGELLIPLKDGRYFQLGYSC